MCARPSRVTLDLYSAPECHLCEVAREELAGLAEELGLEVRVVDIAGDAELERRYRSRIPVGEVGGRTAFKYRVDEGRLRQLVAWARGAESGPPASSPADLRPHEAPAPRFLVDEMLGRLARWLRALGYDSAAADGLDDASLVERALHEERILLTRDTVLIERRPVRRGAVRAVLVRDDHLPRQLAQLRDELGLGFAGAPRCLVCNSPLRPATLEEARDSVPAYVAATHTRFGYCATCDRYVWPGSHWKDMLAVFEGLGLDG